MSQKLDGITPQQCEAAQYQRMFTVQQNLVKHHRIGEQYALEQDLHHKKLNCGHKKTKRIAQRMKKKKKNSTDVQPQNVTSAEDDAKDRLQLDFRRETTKQEHCSMVPLSSSNHNQVSLEQCTTKHC